MVVLKDDKELQILSALTKLIVLSHAYKTCTFTSSFWILSGLGAEEEERALRATAMCHGSVRRWSSGCSVGRKEDSVIPP